LTAHPRSHAIAHAQWPASNPPHTGHKRERKAPCHSFVKVGTENTADIEIHYNDHGSGKPIVLIHGYPLDGNSWERQERVLLANGYRCITYDRRGFGHSSQPTTGYDYDTFAADLEALLDHLSLDEDVVLAGFSMGTGEVTRYLGTYGSARVSKAMLLGVIPPFLLQTDDNPKGVPQDVFDGIMRTVLADRYAWFDNFLANFYNTDVLAPERIGEAALRASFQVAAGASPYASYVCVDTWLTDFRSDLPKIDIPTLVVHGTADRILPFETTAARLRDERLIADLTVVEIADGPHNIGWTYPEETNSAMLEFLSRDATTDTALAATAPSSATSA
jgi:non-heme chloroperoxidase